MRYDYIDSTKGLAVLAVIIGHFFSGEYPIIGNVIYPFHVPVFFIIAGLFMSRKLNDSSFIERVKKKAMIIGRPYFLSVIAMLICESIVGFRLGDLARTITAALYSGGDEPGLSSRLYLVLDRRLMVSHGILNS